LENEKTRTMNDRLKEIKVKISDSATKMGETLQSGFSQAGERLTDFKNTAVTKVYCVFCFCLCLCVFFVTFSYYPKTLN
jgi:hypothetical protein